jgi:AraC family transcriptional regulator
MAAGQVYQRRINAVIDHVSTHIAEELSLETLAGVAHFSAFHFHRIFKAVVGETLNGFVKRLRLERAIFLMHHNPRMTLTQIAFSCGFNSSSDFSRSFKKCHGLTPRAYVKERRACRLSDKRPS